VALVSEIFVESVRGGGELGMTPAFVGFVVVALVGGAAEMSAPSLPPEKTAWIWSVAIRAGSAVQIALFVAPVLVLLSYCAGSAPDDVCNSGQGAVLMVLVGTLTSSFVTSGGRSTWSVGALTVLVYVIFLDERFIVTPFRMTSVRHEDQT